MKRLILPAAAANVLTALTLVGPASAAPPANMSLPEAKSTLLEPIAYDRCRAWRHECAHRWGWNTWRYHRCLRFHGC